VDIGRLFIDNIIIHQVPKRPVAGGGDPLKLSQVESQLTSGIANFFRESIITSLTSSAYRVAFDGTSNSPVPSLVLAALSGQCDDFVGMSQEVARHLYQSQTGVPSSGLLTVMQASVAQFPAIAILKLEKESGVRVREQEYGGKATFDIEHIPDLMLSKNTKVFKVGLFVQTGDTLETIEGSISDKQRGRFPVTEVADFFLKKFLGCRLYEAPEVTTKRFLRATEDFINKEVIDPQSKARYEIALLATLNSVEAEINPTTFAQQHLRVPDQQRYIESLDVADVPSRRPFQKDLTLIASTLSRVRLDFAGGALLMAPPEQFDDMVHVERLGDGRTRATIEDTLTDIHGKK